MPRTRILDRDQGARRLTRRLQGLASGVQISVGIHAEEGRQPHPSGPTIAEVGALAEFGTESQRARPWLRSTIDAERTSLERRLSHTAERVVRGRAGLEAFEALGDDVAEQLRDRTAALAPLAPETVERKGDAEVLEESGTLKGAIRSRMRRLAGGLR